MTKIIKTSGIISDTDNTLIATHSFVENHIIRTCKLLKLKPPSHQKYVSYLKTNPPFEQIFNFFFGNKRGSEVLEAYRKTAPSFKYKAVPGALGFIRKTDKLKIPMVIVTNRLRMIEDRLKQAEINPKSFEDVVSLDIPKPNKHAYDSAIDSLIKLGAKRETILFIGDHPHDYLAVPDNLKANFYAVLTGLNKAHEFTELHLSSENIVKRLDRLSGKIENDNG